MCPLLCGVQSFILQSEWEARKRSIAMATGAVLKRFYVSSEKFSCTCSTINGEKKFSSSCQGRPPCPTLNTALVPHTQRSILSSQPNMMSIPSTQEEGNTLLILYAVALSCQGNTIHISKSDMLVLALWRVPYLKPNSVIIMGSGDRRRQVI
jgi:hypothetical protein